MFRFVSILRLVVVFAACVAMLEAAVAERDLGNGLNYYRLRQLPADLPAKPAGAVPPCVVDVRYVKADTDAAIAFVAWVKFRATTRTPVFIVANSDTSASLVKPFTSQARGGGIAVLGIPTRSFSPHISVTSTADAERRAYDALEKGTPLVSVLTDNPSKVRNDEASLSRDRLADASADAADDALAGKQAPPPVDAALQRAVHLHRALAALKKL